MRTRLETLWVVAGAVLGGLVVGPFRLQPGWFWGVLGGSVGGLLGAVAAHVATRRWHWALRALAVLAVFGCGFFSLWLAAGREFVLDRTYRSLGRQ